MSLNTLETRTMRQLAIIGILTVNIFSVLNLPSPVKAEESQSCTASIANAQKQIETGRSLEALIRVFDVSKSYSDYPQDRSAGYSFALKGKAASTVIRSPKFMKSIATDVIQNCRSVSMVTFVVWETDNIATFGLFPSGKVEGFQCVEFDRHGSRTVWGKQVCL